MGRAAKSNIAAAKNTALMCCGLSELAGCLGKCLWDQHLEEVCFSDISEGDD